MSAVLTRRRTNRGRDRDGYRQASLFGQVLAPLPLEVAHDEEPVAEETRTAPAEAPRAVPAELATVAATPTLDAAISALWEGLLAGELGACPVCGDDLEPQRSAGAGVIGGRCDSCSTTLT